MREFVLLSHTAPLDGSFGLDDLAGGAGRLDVLCRNLTAAFLLSHGIREDVTAWLVVRDELTVECRGDELRNLRPDERSTAALLRGALEVAADRAVSRRPVEASPGIYVRRQGLGATLAEIADRGTLVRLDPAGELLTVDRVPADPTFVLSDHRPFTADERAAIDHAGAVRRGLGPARLHGHHAIAVAHNLCDRAAADHP